MYLEINKVGPVSQIKIELNSINFFIGPQSSGKSTLAKIISFCLWLEKNAVRSQEVAHIHAAFFQKHLVEFHKMESYFAAGSLIRFRGKYIEFEYAHPSDPKIRTTALFNEAAVGKVAYIPAERNLVTLPNIETLKLPDNYVSGYLFEWLTIHKKYSRKSPINLLNLHAEYFYDEKRGDVVALPGGKEITLDVASSGLQSIVPLLVYVQYMTEWIYEHDEDKSYEDKSMINAGLMRHIAKNSPDVIGRMADKQTQGLPGITVNELIDRATADGNDAILNLRERLSRPHFSNLIIEEPELNLFPETQVDLLYAILGLLKSRRDCLVVTTHSPYILYALNNVLLANIVQPSMPKEEFSRIACSKVRTDPRTVSVWEIGDDGNIRSYGKEADATIQDESHMVRENYFNHTMSHIMDDFNDMIMYKED